MDIVWFFVGLGVGLLADFFLVLHMLKPLKATIAKLEAGTKVDDTQYTR
jgi:hypothetical protein